MGVFDAVANFNYGSKAMDIFKHLDIVPGAYMERMCKTLNRKRKSLSSYKGLKTSVVRSVERCYVLKKKRVDDIHIEKEGPSYDYGGH